MQEGLFHLSVKMIQRSKGRSATGAIAYRAGVDITDERTGLRFDYTRKTGISHSEIVLPEGAPEAYRERSKLWNTIEQAETRKNSAVAREFEIALPADLPPAARTKLAMDFTRYLVKRFGVAAETNCHDPHPRNDDGEGSSKNFHAHILTSTRFLTSEGFTDKVRELDAAKTGSIAIEEARDIYAQMVNAAYAEQGVSMFVDHRSYERRGIEQTSQIHVGVNQDGERAEQNAAIIAANEHLAKLERETATIQRQIKNLLVEQTPTGHTIPLFALEPATEEPRFPLETAPEPSQPKPDPRQLELDFATPAPVAVPRHENTEPPPPANVTSLDKVRRFQELQQLQNKAKIHGRAKVEMNEQASLAASFQRELDGLDRPGLMHRLLNTKRWQAYEDKQAELLTRVQTAKVRARKLHTIWKEHKPFQDQWDQGGGQAEYKALAKEFSHEAPVVIPTTDKPQPGYSPLGNSIGMG